MLICIAPNKRKSSEVLAAKQMRFELFCECVNGKQRSPQFDWESVPCRWPGSMVVLVPCTASGPLFADLTVIDRH